MKIRIVISLMGIGMLIVALVIQSFQPRYTGFAGTHPMQQPIPPGFPPPVYNYVNNPLTQEGFELGRKLFYDGRLSKDGYTSCSSCHQQFAAFSDYEHPFSHGFNNAFTLRNTPALYNLAWHKSLHLDGGINHIEVQPLAPITAPNEMASSVDSIIYKLNKDTSYKRLFKAAFGDPKINSQRIFKALAQFTGCIVSADSKYDRVKNGKADFTEWEKRGYQLFQVKCSSCHTEPLFTDLSYRNTGLPVDTFLYDYGRYRITHDKNDSFKFKVPSLRNVAITAPYMHDGRFWGLSDAINHFANKTNNASSLDSLIMHGKPLERIEVQYLVFFMHTLTDSTLLKDQRFADPAGRAYIHFR